MQGDAGAGIITPDQESATRVGAAQGHSHQQRVDWGGATAQHHLSSSSSTRTLDNVVLYIMVWYGMIW